MIALVETLKDGYLWVIMGVGMGLITLAFLFGVGFL